MVNKKLLGISGLFLLLAIVTQFYVKSKVQPRETNIETFIANMDKIESEQLLFHIDNFSIDEDKVQIDGWALIPDHSTETTNALISVYDDSLNYAFTTQKIKREDVAAAYEMSLYEGAGFSSICDMKGLPAGEYKIDLLEIDSKKMQYTSVELPYKIFYDGNQIHS